MAPRFVTGVVGEISTAIRWNARKLIGANPAATFHGNLDVISNNSVSPPLPRPITLVPE
jgi:hypothetical protein